MTAMNETTIERTLLTCPSCKTDIKAALTYKVTARQRPHNADAAYIETVIDVDLVPHLTGVLISHECKLNQAMQQLQRYTN